MYAFVTRMKYYVDVYNICNERHLSMQLTVLISKIYFENLLTIQPFRSMSIHEIERTNPDKKNVNKFNVHIIVIENIIYDENNKRVYFFASGGSRK